MKNPTIHLHPADNVAIAREALPPGTTLIHEQSGRRTEVTVRAQIPPGHKIALSRVPAGEAVRRYGHVIGFAGQAIEPGQHVHDHNLVTEGFRRESASGVDVQPVDYVPQHQRKSFLGFRRADGRVGTRNYIAVIATANCASHTCAEIAHHFVPSELASYPNVDGVIVLKHTGGCGGSSDYVNLQRTLAGMARHPNVGGYLLVGLGCEWNQTAKMEEQVEGLGAAPRLHRTLGIQELGGIRPTVAAGIQAIESMLPRVDEAKRSPQPLSELMLALECGGSDSWSGITANPLVGLAADQLVRQGATIVLSETPEIYGAEHLLVRRAISPAVSQRLLKRIQWWEHHVAWLGTEFDNNPGPGNRAGGLTNIYEKALGGITKSGSTPLMAVYDYAEAIESRGFVFMNTPGYDPISVTGMVAGGCNLVVFTTGRGSVFGFKPAPTIKVCTNSNTYRHLIDDMDLNAGRVLDGERLESLAGELLDLIVEVASGRQSKSEAQGVGEEEFMPWSLPGVI